MSQTALYVSCAEVLQFCQAEKGNLAFLFDKNHGFASRMQAVCIGWLEQMKYEESISQEEQEALQMESHTWALLQTLEADRRTIHQAGPSARSLLAHNPYTPQQSLEQALQDRSRTWTELVAIREWLHETAAVPQAPEALTGYWRFTQLRLEQRARFGERATGSVVNKMDPDVVTREEGSIAAEDAAEDRVLLQALYAHVRAGDLDGAYELCEQAHQPWRAASIRGAILFSWPGLSMLPIDRDSDLDGWEGNRRRTLWKNAAVRLATDSRISEPERALYAALAPSHASASVLYSACRRWEDHLWAQINILIEERRSSVLARINGGFWEHGLSGLDQTLQGELDEGGWQAEVEQALADLASVSVQEGHPASHPFHTSQLYIIQNTTAKLLDEFAIQLKNGMFDSASPEYTSMTRFFAHLCLFLQLADDQDTEVSSLSVQTILEAYLQVLESTGQHTLIAMYASALGDNAVDRYALFLTSLDLSVDADTRRATLADAAHHGLDIARVAAQTAQLTIAQTLKALEPATHGHLPDLAEMADVPASEDEERLRRSLEWTSFLDETDETALENANVILRYFLATGKVEIARRVLREYQLKLPAAPLNTWLKDEFEQYFQFFDVWETLARAQECAAIEAPQMTRDTHAAWLKDYKGLVEQARQMVIRLFKTEWMVAQISTGDGSQPDLRRERYFGRIRRIYIPELLRRLHTLLLDSRHHIPENVKHAIKLVNVVADSRFKMDTAFSPQDGGHSLKVYLDAVRNAVLIGLENGGSDPFRVL